MASVRRRVSSAVFARLLGRGDGGVGLVPGDVGVGRDEALQREGTTGLGPPRFAGQVDGDPHQPGAEAIRGAQPSDGLLRAQEGLLNEVFAPRRISHQSPAEALERPVLLGGQ